MFPRAGRTATVPFVGFAEGFVLSALRKAGVPMQRIRPAVAKLSAEFGIDHALASKRVYTDGAELIFDYAKTSDDPALLTVVRTGQQHFEQVIRDCLKRITYGSDGWAEQLRLPAATALRRSPRTSAFLSPRSRTSSALPSISWPEFFTDRSLGRPRRARRAAGRWRCGAHHGRGLR